MGWRAWLERLQRGRVDAASTAPPSTSPQSAPTLATLGIAVALLPDDQDEDACVGCGLCAQLCPTRVIVVEPAPIAPSAQTGLPRGWPARFELDAGGCIACELCMQVCPTDAIRLFRHPERATGGVIDLDGLRANAAYVRRGRRRSPLGPVPGTQSRTSLVRPPTGAPGGRPRPAADLARARDRSSSAHSPDLLALAHPSETPTSEPTRLETWAHPIDAPTDPDTADVEAVADPGAWLPAHSGAQPPTHDEITGFYGDDLFDDDGSSFLTPHVDGLPDPGDWLPDEGEGEDDVPTDHVTEVDTVPVVPPFEPGLAPEEPEDRAPQPKDKPPKRRG